MSHQLLYDKLYKYGCDETSMQFFKSYLNNRHQFVKNGNSVSNIRKSGSVSVPQGSVGGPLLFLLFINDVTNLSLNGKITLSADDMTLTVSAESFQELEIKANSDLNKINNWIKSNRLIANIDKCFFMIMGRPVSDPHLELQIGTNALKRVTELKILGIWFNNDLSFKTHITKNSKIIFNRLSLLRRLSFSLPINTIKLLYNSIVLPYFDYGDVVWGHTYPTHLKRLSNLQKRAANLLPKNRFSQNSTETLKYLKWLSFENRIKYHSVIFIFKSMNDMTSTQSSKYFTYSENRRSNRLSDDKKLKIIKPNNNFYINSLFYKGLQIFNNLSLNLRSIDNLANFKRQCFNNYF